MKKIFTQFTELIRIRAANKSFHPDAEQLILPENDLIFSLLRTSLDKKEKILVLINVTNADQKYTINCNKGNAQI